MHTHHNICYMLSLQNTHTHIHTHAHTYTHTHTLTSSSSGIWSGSIDIMNCPVEDIVKNGRDPVNGRRSAPPVSATPHASTSITYHMWALQGCHDDPVSPCALVVICHATETTPTVPPDLCTLSVTGVGGLPSSGSRTLNSLLSAANSTNTHTNTSGNIQRGFK